MACILIASRWRLVGEVIVAIANPHLIRLRVFFIKKQKHSKGCVCVEITQKHF